METNNLDHGSEKTDGQDGQGKERKKTMTGAINEYILIEQSCKMQQICYE